MDPQLGVDLTKIPLAPPRPPHVSNFDDPQTLAPVTVAVSAMALTLMLPIAFMRFYVKSWIVRSLWWDDGKSLRSSMYPYLTFISKLRSGHCEIPLQC